MLAHVICGYFSKDDAFEDKYFKINIIYYSIFIISDFMTFNSVRIIKLSFIMKMRR